MDSETKKLLAMNCAGCGTPVTRFFGYITLSAEYTLDRNVPAPELRDTDRGKESWEVTGYYCNKCGHQGPVN